MKVTIRGKGITMKADVGGTLKQKLAFIEAITGVPFPEPTQPKASVEESESLPNEY